MRLRRRRDRTARAGRTETLAMPRTRGLMSGILLMLLGAWAALVPFIGPYFDFTLAAADAWTWDIDALWLSILPGAAAFAGGLMMAIAANRGSGSLGGWLALAGGVWLLIGPAMRLLWDDIFGYGATATSPAIEQIGFFYGVGAAITALSAFALGRMSIRGHRDPGVVEERPVADVERRRHEREPTSDADVSPTRTPG